MQIEFTLPKEIPWKIVVATATLLVLCGTALLGHVVSPAEAGSPVLLRPEIWQAAALARKAAAETVVLQRDLVQLHALLEDESTQPVAAMLLAQRIYANQKNGTSATATARNALIDAAETNARYASGAAKRNDAIQRLTIAQRQADLLNPQETNDGDSAALRLDPDAATR